MITATCFFWYIHSVKFDKYKNLSAFTVIQRPDYYDIEIQPIDKTVPLSAAQISWKEVKPDFLSVMAQDDKPRRYSAQHVSLKGLFKFILPTGQVVLLAFKKKKKTLAVNMIFTYMPILPDYFVYEQPVTLSNTSGRTDIVHSNWTLSLPFLPNEDIQLLHMPGSIYYKELRDVSINVSPNLALSPDSCLAFALPDKTRFVTIRILYSTRLPENTAFQVFPTSLYIQSISIFAVDYSVAGPSIYKSYETIDKFRHILPPIVSRLYYAVVALVAFFRTFEREIEINRGYDATKSYNYVHLWNAMCYLIAPFHILKFILERFWHFGPSVSSPKNPSPLDHSSSRPKK
jgi:hypothetical protein